MATSPVILVPANGVEEVGGHLVARSNQPWLRIAGAEVAFRGQWIRIRYRSSFFDDPVRPLLCFKTATEEVGYQALIGPVLGAAEAIVRVPDDAVSVSISPVTRVGPFDFVIDAIRRISRPRLLANGLLRNPARTLDAAGARLIQARQEARDSLRFALGATPFEQYDTWHRKGIRLLDLHGIDRPRVDWRAAPQSHLIMPLKEGRADKIEATLASLRTQAYQRWTLHAVVGPETGSALTARYRSAMQIDPRIAEIISD